MMSAGHRLGVPPAATATSRPSILRVGPPAPKVPRTAAFDDVRVQRTKLRLDHGDRQRAGSRAALTARAHKWPDQGPWTLWCTPPPTRGDPAARAAGPKPETPPAGTCGRCGPPNERDSIAD
jgi:hypothetical protein